MLGRTILKLIKDGDFRRSLGRRAHELAAERFGRDRFARETMEVYEGALRARRPS